jgi:futalosine hydrolase
MIPDICTMYILLVAATSLEIQPTIQLQGANNGHELGILLTGIGSIPTAWSLMRQIGRRRPDCIIQAGIAGCFAPGHTGEVLAIKEEALGDTGVLENQEFKTVFDLNLMDRNEFPFSNGLLVNPYTRLLEHSGLKQVRAITINEITTDKTRINWYQQNIAPVVESMEGAALHYISLQERIPFLQIRSVSNDIGQRDKSKWDFRSSIANLNQRLTHLLKDLSPDILID